MYFEEGALVRDQNGDSPGRYGDACFDTFAFALSWFWTSPGHEYHPLVNHSNFITPTGTLREKHSIWRQGDQSEDNEKPLLMFLKETSNIEDWQFVADRCWDDLKTGNGHYITLGYIAELMGWPWLRCFCQFVQVLFFWFPFYWDDGRMNKLLKEIEERLTDKVIKLEAVTTIIPGGISIWERLELLWKYWPIGNNWKRCDGYLQWAIIAYKTPWPFRRLIRKSTLNDKILAYYRPEIDVGPTTVLRDVIETHFKLVDLL